MDPILSLVTGSLNRPEGLRRLIDSIRDRTPVPWELVISDASDTPLQPTDERIRVIVEKPRRGCVAGYNAAFKEARGEWVIWLNDDAEVQPGYAEAAISFMEANPEIGLGALYYCESVPPFKVNEYCGMIYANFGIISRELGNSVGWFDPDLTMYGCDNSLTFRVLLAGLGIGTIPTARVWHHVVQDEWKVANQKLRDPDSEILRWNYGVHIPRMMRVYERTQHLAGPLVIGE